MKRLEKVFLILLTIVAVQSVAVANANAQEMVTANETMLAQQTMIAQLDVDQDGLISLKEAVSDTELLRKFGRLDDNKDGKLSEHELHSGEFVVRATAKS